MTDSDDLVGRAEIARRLGVRPKTVSQWRWRGTADPMPSPVMTVARSPIWDWPTIEAWARETGRMT